MPNQTLTTMTSASALTGAELFYSVQGGADRKVTSSQFYTYLTSVSSFVSGGTQLTLASDTNVTLSPTGLSSIAVVSPITVTAGWTGTLSSARLNANVIQTVTNDTNVTGAISSQNLTFGWAGTLSSARLNASVVQSVTNDTNVTGAVSSQNLTLGWLGTLSSGRLNANVVQTVTNDTNVTGAVSSQNLTLGWTGVLPSSRIGTVGSSQLSTQIGSTQLADPFTVGFTITPYSTGTISAGTFTPNPLNGNYQYYTNGGAHTLAASTVDSAIDILMYNSSSAGVVTFSGFTVGANTGDALTTTSSNRFIVTLRRINAISAYSITALQ